MDTIGTVSLGHGDVHLLVGLFGSANEKAGFERDVGDDAVGALGGAGGAQFVGFKILARGVLGFGVLLEEGVGENYRAGFGLGIGRSEAALCTELDGAARLVADVGGFPPPTKASDGRRGLFRFVSV